MARRSIARYANAPAQRGRLLSDGLRCSLVTGGRTLPASNVPSRLLDAGHRQFSTPLAVLKRQLDIATDEGSMGSQKLWQRAASRKCRERLHVHLKPVL